ncbi:hypothetical protein ACCT19_36145, partial [Rhizobium ruizarguesonis]
MANGGQRTISIDKLREFIPHLKSRLPIEEMSDLLRGRGDDVDYEKIRRIIKGDVTRTHPMHGISAVFFDALMPPDLPDMEIARDAFLMHELIAISWTRQERGDGELSMQFELAESHYRQNRGRVDGVSGALLDYVMGQVKLRRVDRKLIEVDTDSKDSALWDATLAELKLLRLADSRYLHQALKVLKDYRDVSENTSFVDFFYVRSLEARFYANYQIDLRQHKDTLVHSRKVAKEFAEADDIRVLIANAKYTGRALVAYNAAELAMLAD